jgi:hypoxanthine phosphoribosyltransferase
METVKDAVGEILIEEDVLQARITELGQEISKEYEGRDLLLVGVLKGAVFFMADLMRELTIPCEIDFMAISSYGAATDSSGVGGAGLSPAGVEAGEGHEAELERGVGEILIDEETLQARIVELGGEISAGYKGRDLLLVGVLKGAVFFMADLMRELTVPCEIDFMAISSYGAATDSSGVVRILKDLDINVAGRDVLVVEDIIDSGLTLSYLMRNLKARKPASLEVVALLTKPDRREIEVPVRYVGFEIPNRFVIGYGLDFAERYRNLPYVAVLHADLVPNAT